jgi:hypothetical protein
MNLSDIYFVFALLFLCLRHQFTLNIHAHILASSSDRSGEQPETRELSCDSLPHQDSRSLYREEGVISPFNISHSFRRMPNRQASDSGLAMVTEYYPLAQNHPRAVEFARANGANRLAVVVDAMLICPPQNSPNVDSWFSNDELLLHSAFRKGRSRVFKPQPKRRMRSRLERYIKRVLAASRILLANVHPIFATRIMTTATRQAKSPKVSRSTRISSRSICRR